MSNTPPPEVAAAAAVVQRWLDQPAIPKSADEISRMTPAQKLDYARQFNQKKMPDWTDQRGGSRDRYRRG
jgi:hypothetical protein